ncbi:lytic transglycosylase domain-containing protein [Sphingobacterium sp. SRCM116780]|uniref:lytic transglycosylase domain-containing protein n=1 Tax=Sphingobacterium sp. SRCM116780 TaxID=2907623 RepID=UPI001F17A88B|nr:lytic transglycosylase domain-containing protein [Sphingobacterium sp. SRCM116780]UIR58024.1 lytic transglycosylase domain-containing protein [Sphingobacterium sp. SRCM116780]
MLSKLYSNPNRIARGGDKIITVIAPNNLSREGDEKEKNDDDDNSHYLSSLTFANDTLPINRPNVESKLLRYFKNFSFKKRGSYSLHKKAEAYLPKIEKILASYNIPEDFKYIPLVESGLDRGVVSSKGAGGYWQFMPATARLYGLKVNGSVDERLDLVKSTHAAAKYIKSLYKEFGNWTLVAAAYNVGGGSLKGTIRRQKEDSYYDLKLNNETGSYVYKLISMKEIIENPQKHGYTRYANRVDKDEDNSKENLL